jgi:DNA ligase (NAD+)
MAQAIRGFFSNERNRTIIRKLEQQGIEILDQQRLEPENSSLAGKKFCFTGTLESMTRSEAKKVVEERGGQVVSAVSSQLDFLVAGTEPGSKLDKAASLGIRILDQDGFMKLIKEE